MSHERSRRRGFAVNYDGSGRFHPQYHNNNALPHIQGPRARVNATPTLVSMGTPTTIPVYSAPSIRPVEVVDLVGDDEPRPAQRARGRGQVVDVIPPHVLDGNTGQTGQMATVDLENDVAVLPGPEVKEIEDEAVIYRTVLPTAKTVDRDAWEALVEAGLRSRPKG